jgi:hypothetical protein
MEQLLAGQVVVGIVVQAGMAAVLTAWGRWVATRMGGSRAWTWAARGPWISFVLLLTGMVLTSWFLVRAFGAISNVDPGRKASVLAESISNALNVSAVFFIAGYAILLASVVMFIVGSVRTRPPAN